MSAVDHLRMLSKKTLLTRFLKYGAGISCVFNFNRRSKNEVGHYSRHCSDCLPQDHLKTSNQKVRTMTTSLDITIENREQYIAWRAAWRTEYKALSISIRATKLKISRMQKAGDSAGWEQSALSFQRVHAREMMELRMVSKIRARELRAAFLQKLEAIA